MLGKAFSHIILYLIAFFNLAAFVASVSGQGNRRVADADPKYIATQEGATIELLCRIARPIISCRFNLPGVEDEVKLNPGWARTDNFQYFGSGLDNGQCGIRITGVREEYHGNATCQLDPNDGQLDAIGTIEIVIAKAPQPPTIEIFGKRDKFEAGDEIESECISQDGRPAAEITWFLDDQPLSTNNIEIIESPDRGTIYYTVHSKLRYRLKPEDHTRHLICRATHPGYQQKFMDARHQLDVNYRPIALPETFISGLEIGSGAVIGPITIQANPRPTLKWTVDGTVINQGEQSQRFVSSDPIQVGIGLWNASLTIVELTLQDTTRTFRLRANNAFGSTDYQIRIGGSQDAAGK